MSPTAHDVLYAREPEINKHWGLLQDRLGKILPKVGKYRIEDSVGSGINGDLMCRDVNGSYVNEKVLRERGGDVPVVPLLVTQNRTIRYWISIHQSWSEPEDRRRETFLYHTTGMTVFFGKEGAKEKIQLFRAEWPGLRKRHDGLVEFEAPGAGHPHWQFDAYQQHLRERRDEEQRRAELEDFLKQEHPEAENFSDTVIENLSSEEEAERIAHTKRLTKIHFASSTRWAETPWDGTVSSLHSHAQAPASLNEIINWVTSTISYVQQEASR
jgi:hypothetical protein